MKKEILKGIVVHYDESRGFGFIRANEVDQDIFVHIRNVKKKRALSKDQEVVFELEKTDKGYNALSVKPYKKHKALAPIYFIIIAGLVVISMVSFSIASSNLQVYMVVINLITFCLYGYDKFISSGEKLRVPEKVLHLLALFGGSVFAYISQVLFNHKLKKQPFQSIFLVISLFQIIYLMVYITNQSHKVAMAF